MANLPASKKETDIIKTASVSIVKSSIKHSTRRLNAEGLVFPITTFMIASDPYLQEFVRDFTKINNGRAFYSSLKGLGEFVFEDYERNRRKTVR
jgi:Ca-activated chloride channel family protein